jgi:hypothetical protein
MALPAQDLRSNLGTWAVTSGLLPTVAYQMTQALPAEAFDPDFQGQNLETTYFDTRGFALRKARRSKDRYLTLRIRCYGTTEAYALSVKTEQEKFRQIIAGDLAEALIQDGIAPTAWSSLLPAHLVARLLELAGPQPLLPVVTLCFRRYAVEDRVHRLTLDLDVRANTGKHMPCHVLEYKSTRMDTDCPLAIPLPPIKLSKFLWATSVDP